MCNGLKWVADEDALTLDHDNFGKLFPCPGCVSPPRRIEYLRSVCNLKGKERSFTFVDWWVTVESRRLAIREAREALDNRNDWLTLWGGNGSGKSYLGAAIVNAAMERGIEARFWMMADLLDHLRDAYNPKSVTPYSNLFHDLIDCPVLVIDECHVFNSTPWALEKFRQLASERYRRSLECLTVWITNLDPLDREHAPPDLEFLFSRMSQFPVVVLDNGDIRPTIRQLAASSPAPDNGRALAAPVSASAEGVVAEESG